MILDRGCLTRPLCCRKLWAVTAPDISALRSICSRPYGFWLDSAVVDGRMGQRSFWGENPSVILRSWGRRIEVERPFGKSERLEGDPFEVLRSLLAEHEGREGAAVGYLGYGLKQHIERLPDTVLDDLGLPDCVLAFYDRLNTVEPHQLAPATTGPLPPSVTTAGLCSNFAKGSYEEAVRRALGYIRAGDIYQVNLSQRFQAPYEGDPFDLYLALRTLSPSPFAAFLRFPEFAVLSSSPERFLRYDPTDRGIETRPIKGTRPRGRDAESDRAMAEELAASEKDRAENLMIVDLERNDLGRVAEIGSVNVPGMFELETFANVHHLTSTVRARLQPGSDIVDLLKATFPGGSITGAPKIRAMEIIDELEPVARGVYTGAIGYIGFDGSTDLNIAIRTMVVRDGLASFHVGSGIVADSDPTREYQETLHKGSAMARALVGEGLR
ncbi:MAG: aminodeoxychorismate synthase component I [Chloroflexi bacterium]|nr:aminodeoxychorismate synthase component I [Chloroflexota bacterium]